MSNCDVKHLFVFNEKTKMVELANNDDNYYVEYFYSPEQLKEFIDKAKVMLSKLVLEKEGCETK